MKNLRVIAMALALTLIELSAHAFQGEIRTGIPGFRALVQYPQSDGSLLVAGGLADPSAPDAYSFAIGRFDQYLDGDVYRVPVWGYYEFITDLLVQPNGKIIVAGLANDPIAHGPAKCLFYPGGCAPFIALTRLNPDFSIDRSFNGTGRLIIGTEEYSFQVGVPSELSLLPGSDGSITVAVPYDGPIAQISANGTFDNPFPGPSDLWERTSHTESSNAGNFQGLWWNPSEPGWGISFAHQGDVIFATWATYNAAGTPIWLSMTATRFAPGSYSGTLYLARGPAFDSTPFDSSRVTQTIAGTAALDFSSPTDARLSYKAFGGERIVAITPYVFGPQPTCSWGGPADLALATNYQDLWFAAPAGSEAGWAISLAHQGDTIVATWFTYDVEGMPLWLSGAAAKSSTEDGYAGPLYRTAVPRLTPAALRPDDVTRTSVGSMRLSFSEGNNATFSYTVNGIAQSKAITRFVFRGSGTACN